MNFITDLISNSFQKQEQIKINNDETCLICWESSDRKNIIYKFKTMIPFHVACECNGNYHFDCIGTWIKTNNSCPICRIRITKTNRIVFPKNIPNNCLFLYQLSFFNRIFYYLVKLGYWIAFLVYLYHFISYIF